MTVVSWLLFGRVSGSAVAGAAAIGMVMIPALTSQGHTAALALHWSLLLAIGLYTPPVGGALFVAAWIGQVGMGAISRALMHLFLVSLLILMLITYVQALPMFPVWLLC